MSNVHQACPNMFLFSTAGNSKENSPASDASLEKYFRYEDDEYFAQNDPIVPSTSYNIPRTDRFQFRGYTFKRVNVDQSLNMTIPPKRYKEAERPVPGKSANIPALKGGKAASGGRGKTPAIPQMTTDLKIHERPAGIKSANPQVLKGPKPVADGNGGQNPAAPQIAMDPKYGERSDGSRQRSPQAKSTNGDGSKKLANPQAVEGRKKEGMVEIDGKALAVYTSKVECWFKNFMMIFNVVNAARASLNQIMDEVPDINAICDAIKKMDHFSCAMSFEIQTGLGYPDVKQTNRKYTMRRAHPGRQSRGRKRRKPSTAKLYWHNRVVKLLQGAKKLLARRKRLSLPSSCTQSQEQSPNATLQTPENSGAIGVNSRESLEYPPGCSLPSSWALSQEQFPDAALQTPEHEAETPPVYAEVTNRWEWENERYSTLHIAQEFRFVNLEHVTSYAQAVSALHLAVQEVLDHVNESLETGDCVQLRFEGGNMQRPLFSVKKVKGALDADEFLSNLANLLQSNMELCLDGVLRLVVTIVRPPRGGSRPRALRSIPYSAIINKKRKHLIDFTDVNSKLCFGASLVRVMSKEVPTDAELAHGALQLYQAVHWPVDKEVSLSDIPLFEDHLQVNIQIAHYGNKGWGLFKPQGHKYTQTYTLLLHDNHFYGVLNIKGLFGARNYCQYCHKLYSHIHDCIFFCRLCLRKDCASNVNIMKKCKCCKMKCRSRECLELHTKLAAENKVPCTYRKFCEDCGRFQNAEHFTKDCIGRVCNICWAPRGEEVNHFCFMRPLKEPKISTHYIFYDIESRQDTGLHIPNYCYARSFWGETVRHFKKEASVKKGVPDWIKDILEQDAEEEEEEEESEEYDDDNSSYSESIVEPDSGNTKKKGEKKKAWPYDKSWEFRGESCIEAFIRTFTEGRVFEGTTFIAHNSKGYDGYFILNQLVKEKLEVELITQGGKLITIAVPALDIKFLDSLCHLPMGLSKLPKCLGLRQESKGYFPHYFNTPENEQYEGPLPPPEAYGVQHMMPSEQKAFLKWHEENKTKTFNLQRELAAYCQQDVNILVQACTKYRHEIMTLTKKRVKGYDGEYEWFAIDPLQYPTLAGVCLSMYKFKFLEKNKIAIPHPDNYHRQCKRYSSASIQWLSYIAHKEKTRVQHALNGGEICIDSLYVDGYMVLNGRGICLEFLGCFFHGCALCYHSEDWNPLLGKTYGALFNATQERTAVLRSKGFEVRSIWEHEWKEMVRNDNDVKNYLATADFPDPLAPRDALFGGRTNAIRLYYRAKPGEQILYYDFTSLYPYVNKTKEYPLGHPKIIYENFEPVTAYFGIVKAKISPPRGLFFPVLPARIGGKLMFVLCAACAESSQRTPCEHTDEERALTGTWCTIELNVAIKKGYKVVKIFEVWHFENRSDELFSDYMKLHLRHKQEASGYPSWCVSEADKNKYIADYEQKEGITLRKDKIAVNPAKRQIAKLFLNSLWGKFGQRTNLPNTQVVRDPDEYFNLLFSESYKVSMFEFLADDAVCVSWKHATDRLTTKGRKNEFIACFTTAYARLELYNLLDKLQDRVLYHDTDSVIFVQREGEWKPSLGDYLGDLTSEVPEGMHITEFVSGGPKTYGYKICDGSACMKVKGITLNVTNSEKINFDSLKDLVFTYASDNRDGSLREIVVEQPGIVRDKRQWLIHTKLLRKTQKVVYDKRVIVEDFKTLPYGY
ncbi:uncharacterized protein LOC140703714 isoform X1 [Pogona vitticeps]